jgi:hypothetical protein
LGALTGVDVLRLSSEQAPLLDALQGVDRLVLLGDVLELRHGPLRSALAGAAPVLKMLGDALGRDREVLIVPGNHDHMLLRAWFERRACASAPAPLGLESEVEWHEEEPLATVARALHPAPVRVLYPGVWLRGDVYASHGHYGDRHNTAPIMERLGAGLMARFVPERDGGPERAEDYEATLAPIYAWADAVAQGRAPDGDRGSGSLQVAIWRELTASGSSRSVRRAGLRAGFPIFVGALNRARLGPLRADVSGPELRRGGLRGFAEVLARLEVKARYAVFGHTHRAGPLPQDEVAEWTRLDGSAMVNAGCWVREHKWLGPDPARSPYRPGFCVLLDDGDTAPEVRNLLD